MRKLSIPSLHRTSIIVCLSVFWLNFSTRCLQAQSIQSSKAEKFHPVLQGTDIYSFTGSLSWQTSYYPGLRSGELERYSETELQIEFRNINMLNSHFGLGFKIYSMVYMRGFFEGIGLGGIGAGPLLRYYLLENIIWQPYIQGSLAAGYNLALGSASGIEGGQGFRYRSSLKAGLEYKFSNAFGLFFEIGPAWEYTRDLQLYSRALLINIGVELFRL